MLLRILRFLLLDESIRNKWKLITNMIWPENIFPILQSNYLISEICSLLARFIIFMKRSSLALACLVRINRIKVGLKHISLLANSFGKFFAAFAISLTDALTVCLRTEFTTLFPNRVIRWKLFFPSYLSGKNILLNLPLNISLDSRWTLNRMFCNHRLGDLFFFALWK